MRQQKERRPVARPRVEVDFVGPAGPLFECVQATHELMERLCDVLEVYDCEAPDDLRDALVQKVIELKIMMMERVRIQPGGRGEGGRDEGTQGRRDEGAEGRGDEEEGGCSFSPVGKYLSCPACSVLIEPVRLPVNGLDPYRFKCARCGSLLEASSAAAVKCRYLRGDDRPPVSWHGGGEAGGNDEGSTNVG